MRIDDVNRSNQAQATQKTGLGQSSAAPAKNKGSAPPTADSSAISSIGQALQGPSPDRLEQLRLSVESGRYPISAQKLAQAIIAEASKD